MTGEGLSIIHYEVYTLEGQRWNLHARFSRAERDDALEEARTVERTLGMAAKVVRETYYPANNQSEEAVVYAGDQALRARAAAGTAPRRGRGQGRGGASAPDFAIPDFRDNRSQSPATGSMGMLAKLLLIVAASMTVGGAATGIVNVFFEKLPAHGLALGGQTESLLVFSTFVFTFLATALPLAMRIIDWQDGKPARGAKAKPRPTPLPREKAPVPPPAAAPTPAPPRPEELEKVDEDLDWEGVENEDVPLPPVEDLPPVDPLPTAEQPKEAEEAKPAEKEEAKDAPVVPMESMRVALMRFLNILLAEIKKTRPALDAYNMFGIDLVLAGAVDVLGNHHALEFADKRDVLKETIEVMGTKRETAQAFADKYEDYLVEPRYMAMVQVGRSSMEAFLAGAETIQEGVGKVFETWNKPQSAAQGTPRIVTILFTDMVGSTDLTQSRGDQAAQHVVRRHNSIVRGALAECSGKEIKHTGDGIMASFNSAANGVEAAMAIQRAIAEHNERHPEQQLHLRIGMNAGEPIEEEDDLFGTTVQLAARVCAKAETDEILCTNVVRELSAGKGLRFAAKGAQELKGFKDPVPLYQVFWAPQADASSPETKAAAGKPAKNSTKVSSPRG